MWQIIVTLTILSVAYGFQPSSKRFITHVNPLINQKVSQCVRSEKSTLTMQSGANFGATEEYSAPPVGWVEPKTSLWDIYVKIMDKVTVLFPLWTIISAIWALQRPNDFAWFTTKYFTGSLGALMLSMGITLTADDFLRVLKQPKAVIIGFLLCYGLCPVLGLGLGKLK